ncbi:MAG: NnrS family protein [Gammaproteobacteria bacterium]|nr:NnrS family protein [Gammaproteobacteria bacterium]
MRSQFLSMGFRPFFLGAAGAAVALMGLWIIFLLTGISTHENLMPVLWHGHEMLFGFAMAVIAGFLLTAMQNWTGLRLVTPGQLALLVAVWLAGRLAFAFSGVMPLWLISLLDLGFLPLLCLIVARTLIRAGNRRNYSLIAMLLIFWTLNILMHLEFHYPSSGMAYLSLDVSVLLATTLLVFMGGRVIPFFTDRRLPGATPVQWPWLNWASTLTVLALIPTYLIVGRDIMLAPLLLIAAVSTAGRLLAWKPWRTFGEPLLWILHLGYAWVPVGLIFLAMHVSGTGLPWTAGIHALMAGAMSTLILGMMARVALGHSGRPITAPPLMVAGFLIITIAAVSRVAAAMITPDWLLIAAALLWALAFLIYLVVYTPIILRS